MNLRERTIEIKKRMASGELTYEQARAELQPYIDEANVMGATIAKKHGKKFSKLTFSYVTR